MGNRARFRLSLSFSILPCPIRTVWMQWFTTNHCNRLCTRVEILILNIIDSLTVRESNSFTATTLRPPNLLKTVSPVTHLREKTDTKDPVKASGIESSHEPSMDRARTLTSVPMHGG